MTAYAHSGDAELLPLATQPVNPLQTTQCPANPNRQEGSTVVLGVAAFRTREPYTLIALVALKPSNGDGLDADKIAAVGAGLAARPSIWMRAGAA